MFNSVSIDPFHKLIVLFIFGIHNWSIHSSWKLSAWVIHDEPLYVLNVIPFKFLLFLCSWIIIFVMFQNNMMFHIQIYLLSFQGCQYLLPLRDELSNSKPFMGSSVTDTHCFQICINIFLNVRAYSLCLKGSVFNI